MVQCGVTHQNSKRLIVTVMVAAFKKAFVNATCESNYL